MTGKNCTIYIHHIFIIYTDCYPWSFQSSTCIVYQSYFQSRNPWWLPPNTYQHFPSIEDYTKCIDWHRGIFSHLQKNRKKMNLVLQNSDFVGSCVIIQKSKILSEGGQFNFEVSNITIRESKCHMALEIIDCDTSAWSYRSQSVRLDNCGQL